MSHTDNPVLCTMRPWKDAAKEIGLLILQISSESVCANVRHLDHTRKPTIHE